MKSFLSVLLLSAVSMLPYAKGQHEYNLLTSSQKTIVDMVIDDINKKENTKHINFEKTISPPYISEWQTYFKMYLKETACSKIKQTLKYEHRPDCQFRGKRFNCVVCETGGSSNFYINCLRAKWAHTNEEERNSHCLIYHHGAGSPAALQGHENGHILHQRSVFPLKKIVMHFCYLHYHGNSAYI